MENDGLKQEPLCQSPLRDLQQQILQYNNNCRNAKYRLKMEKAEQYAGALDIHYSDGSKIFVHQIVVTNTTTCSDLIMQTLAHLHHPKQQRNSDSAEHGCLVLRQGEVERELGMNEKPLELALDCSTQGLAAPLFCFKSLPPKKPPDTLDHTNWHTERSNGSLKLQKGSPHPLCHTTSLQPSDTALSMSAPSTTHKHTHGKWAVSDIITRSLRVRKKPKNHTGSLPSNKHEAFSLISPVLAEKQFTMSTVMHIYYRSSSNEHYCKGVLVSEKSLTREVIAQALERYDLKFCDPSHFGLYEVVGKWEEVGPDGLRSNGKVLPTHRSYSKHKSSSKQVIEEFFICFDRELQLSECPYNSQFYFEPSNGYSRRFELRKKENADRRVSLNSGVPKKGKVAASSGVVSDVLPVGVLSQGLYYAPLDSAFILFVRLYDHKKELLVHRLVTEQTYLIRAVGLDCSNDIVDVSNRDSSVGIGKQEERISKIELFSPEFTHEINPICQISKRPLNGSSSAEEKCQYSFEVMECGYQVFVNGSVVEKSTVLRFGDLVAIGQSYVFIFYDTHADQPQSRYTWEKNLIPCSGAAGANAAAATQHCLTPVPPDPHTPLQCTPESTSTRMEASSIEMDQSVPVFDLSKEASDSVDASSGDGCNSCATLQDSFCCLHGSSDGLCSNNSSGGLHSSTGGFQAKNFEASNQEHDENHLTVHRSLFDSDAKEDIVIASVTERFEVALAKEKLLPASILATCARHQLRTRGAVAAAVSVGKASQGLQLVLWSCVQKLADRKYELQNEELQMKSMDEILQLLKPVFFWLSNTMEFYNFIVGNTLVPNDSVNGITHSTLSNLQEILVYAFQQAFYTISKVLYHTLPVMIASCPPDGSSGHRILIGQVVDFLQAVLDLLNDLQINVEVIFQLYSNLFFFINAAMFNYLVMYGRELGVFQYHSGKSLRVNLDLLEGWACQQGFKSVVLNYMVKLSSVVDLLCIPSDELLQMDWATLRQEFPVLHAAQLHFILGCYEVNPPEGLPAAWAPTADDAEDALNTSAVNESFNTGPEFCIPSLGYSLDPSQPTAEAQSYLESLEKAPSPRKSVGVMPLIEDRPSLKMPDLITKVGMGGAKGSKRPSRTPSKHSNSGRQKLESSHEYQIHELTGQAANKPMTPLECPDQNSYDKWVLSHFPKGSRIVTVPRGDKGFGVIMVEGKDNATDDSAIFVQAILPGSTASETNQLTAGDRILAIDCQKLDGADYLIAQKYLNEAEEEVVLVLAAKS